jgi:hypothetical protein
VDLQADAAPFSPKPHFLAAPDGGMADDIQTNPTLTLALFSAVRLLDLSASSWVEGLWGDGVFSPAYLSLL